MRRRARDLVDCGSRLGADYQRTRASLAAGGLAYFVALSIAPAALAFGTLAGLVLDPAEVRDALDRLAARAPESVGNLQPVIDALVATVEHASDSAFTFTTLVSAVIAVYAASKVVFGLRLAMNTIFEVVETRSGLIERGIAAVITLVGLVAAVAVVVLLTLLPRVLDWLDVSSVRVTTGSWLIDWLVVAAAVYLTVRWSLRHAPNQAAGVPWTSPGVLVGTAGIVAATAGVGIYARFSASLNVAVLVFGTAVVLLLWLYLCFVALLWGAIIEADRQRSVSGRTSAEDQRQRR